MNALWRRCGRIAHPGLLEVELVCFHPQERIRYIPSIMQLELYVNFGLDCWLMKLFVLRHSSLLLSQHCYLHHDDTTTRIISNCSQSRSYMGGLQAPMRLLLGYKPLIVLCWQR